MYTLCDFDRNMSASLNFPDQSYSSRLPDAASLSDFKFPPGGVHSKSNFPAYISSPFPRNDAQSDCSGNQEAETGG